jgi:hypothetical protein
MSISPSRFFVGALCFVILVRYYSLFPSVIDWDESLYLVMAQHWLQGDIPYHKVWDTHSVGVPALFAAIQLFFGSSIFAIRISACVAIAVTMTIIFLITRLINIGAIAAITATGLYLAWMARKWSYAANAELYLNALVATAFYLVATSTAELRDRRHALIASTGAALLLGIALQVKHVVLAETAFISLAAISSEARRGIAAAVSSATMIGAALAAPTALVILYFWWVGHLDEYWAAVVTTTLEYASGTPSLSKIVARVPPIALVPLGTAVAGTAAILILGDVRSRTLNLTLVWCGAAVIDVVLPRQFWYHYFILLAPPAAVVGGLITAQVTRLWRPLPVIVVFAVILVTLGRPFGIIQDITYASWYRDHDAPRVIADRIALDLGPDDYIFVYNYEPIIYYLTNARLPTRYAFPGDWSEPERYRAAAGIDPVIEIERVFSFRPRYLIVSDMVRDIPADAHRRLLDHLVDYHVAFTAYGKSERLVTIYLRNADPQAN